MSAGPWHYTLANSCAVSALPLYTLQMTDDAYAVQAAVVGERKASAHFRPQPLVQGQCSFAEVCKIAQARFGLNALWLP